MGTKVWSHVILRHWTKLVTASGNFYTSLGSGKSSAVNRRCVLHSYSAWTTTFFSCLLKLSQQAKQLPFPPLELANLNFIRMESELYVASQRFDQVQLIWCQILLWFYPLVRLLWACSERGQLNVPLLLLFVRLYLLKEHLDGIVSVRRDKLFSSCLLILQFSCNGE